MSHYESEITNPKLMEEIVDLAKRLVCNLSVAEEDYSEERPVTKSSLMNMLKAAKLAEEKGNYEIFEISVAYIARDTEYDDELNRFVRTLLRELRKIFQKYFVSQDTPEIVKEKIKVAKELIRTTLMIFKGLEAKIKIVCKQRRGVR